MAQVPEPRAISMKLATEPKFHLQRAPDPEPSARAISMEPAAEAAQRNFRFEIVVCGLMELQHRPGFNSRAAVAMAQICHKQPRCAQRPWAGWAGGGAGC